MKNKELIKSLNSLEEADVLVKVEGGLYYPINKIVKTKEGVYIILCRDVRIIDKETGFEPVQFKPSK